jgi:hypothetical protein
MRNDCAVIMKQLQSECEWITPVNAKIAERKCSDCEAKAERLQSECAVIRQRLLSKCAAIAH